MLTNNISNFMRRMMAIFGIPTGIYLFITVGGEFWDLHIIWGIWFTAGGALSLYYQVKEYKKQKSE